LKKVEIYTSAFCGHCHRAKVLLQQKGVKFREVDVTVTPGGRTELEKRARRCTLPQVFIDGKPIGGSDDLLALDLAGELDKLLGLK